MGKAIARVVRVLGPVWAGWRSYRPVALDEEAKVVELRPTTPPDGAERLVCIGGQVVGRATVPLRAVRAAETALAVIEPKHTARPCRPRGTLVCTRAWLPSEAAWPVPP